MELKAFDELFAVNVNGHTEKKKTGNTELTYLSWPFAWAEIKKRFPDAQYEIEKFDGLPYVYDPQTGYMVYTTVTIEGITHEMWLPVMDGANKAMRAEAYTYKTGFGQYAKEKTCEAATMFDINKTIMRCLVKNLAMFGLGLYIYAGEDLPDAADDEARAEVKKARAAKKQASTDTGTLTESQYWQMVEAFAMGQKTKSGGDYRKTWIINYAPSEEQIAKFDRDVENYRIARNQQ